jgi:hypothetical protein
MPPSVFAPSWSVSPTHAPSRIKQTGNPSLLEQINTVITRYLRYQPASYSTCSRELRPFADRIRNLVNHLPRPGKTD